MLFCNILLAQSPVEKQNRVVYNRIEYFFNTRQTDSIYELGNSNFKKSVAKGQFIDVIETFYAMGKISSAFPVTFSKGIAGYNLIIGKNKASLELSVDSTFHFNYFLIKDQEIIVNKTETVNQKVNKTNRFDEYVDEIAQSYIKKANTQSLAIGILNKGVMNTFFYGETSKGIKASLPSENTIYEIGSITKLFTATLLADLVEKQIISLDDSITKFLPDSIATNPYLQKITFKQLANHTSGLTRLPANLEKAPKYSSTNPYSNYTRKELFAFLKDYSSTREPGDEYEYSNLGFGLLGELIAIISKKPYTLLIKEVITTPLQLHNTLDKIPSTAKNLSIAKAYNEEGIEVPTWNFQAIAGAGVLKSTVADMLRFAAYQFKMPENELENALAQTRLFTFYLPPNTDIGLGWHMNMVNGLTQYWHNGATGGSSSFFGIVPDKKSAVIVLSNSAHSVDDISSKILEKMTEM